MSLIDLLAQDKVWTQYLEYKKNSLYLPNKVIKRYEEFIDKKAYKEITKKLKEESYSFSIPRKVLIGKNGKSKKRAVYLYRKDEIYVLKVLSYLLYKYDYLFAPNLFSFRKETGVMKAIKLITRRKNINKMYAYKVDIKNYFNSIPVTDLLSDLKDTLNDNKLYSLFEQILLDKRVLANEQVIYEEKGIMAGVPLSAFLANFYLRELDQYFYDNDILYFRYADDIIVFAPSKDLVLEYSKKIKDYLSIKGLSINSDKEYYYNPSDEIEFLGFSYKDGVIDISSNSFKKIKGKIKRASRGLRRWMIKKDAPALGTLKAMNRKFNHKFYGKDEDDLTWKYWYFPIINTTKTLKKIDLYMQQEQRYLLTGVHNKKNFEKVPYQMLKESNYRSLVSEYYKSR